MSEKIRPPIIHLAGDNTKCCHCFILIDCDGVYKCACGKRQEARAQKIIKGMAEMFGEHERQPDPAASPEDAGKE